MTIICNSVRLILLIAFVAWMCTACKPSSKDTKYVKQEGVYGSISEAVAHKEECHTLIIRNLQPDGTVKENPERLNERITELFKVKKLIIYGIADNEIQRYFEQLTSMEELTVIYAINRNAAVSVNGLSKLTKLTSLHLEDLQLQEIPELPTSLRKLNLKNNLVNSHQLEKIPKNSITHLNLNFNPLKVMPKSFKINFKELEVLELEYCELYEFPENILEINSINELNIASNVISTVPNEIHLLRSLKKLNLFNCPIVEMPSSIFEIEPLETLWLPSSISSAWVDSLKMNAPKINVMISENSK